MQKQSTGLRSSAAFLELARAPFSAALALNMLSASYTNAMPSESGGIGAKRSSQEGLKLNQHSALPASNIFTDSSVKTISNRPPLSKEEQGVSASQQTLVGKPKQTSFGQFFVNLNQEVAFPEGKPEIYKTLPSLGVTGYFGKDKLVTWSLSGGPAIQVSDSPKLNTVNWQLDAYATLSPMKNDEVNIYAKFKTIWGADKNGPLKSLNSGIVVSLAKSEIFPDILETINLPERGIYVRAQNRSGWNGSNSYASSITEFNAGWAESWYPFQFAIEAGPQLIQRYSQGDAGPLSVNLGATLNVQYIIGKKSQLFLEYNPSIAFSSSNGPTVHTIRTGVGFKF